MNILLWILQILLALHTVMGALWKLSNSEKSMPSLRRIPHGVWRAMSGLELLCSLGLIVPALRPSLSALAPLAAACIAGEMLVFSALHLQDGKGPRGPMIYWLVVAGLCAVIAYGRLA